MFYLVSETAICVVWCIFCSLMLATRQKQEKSRPIMTVIKVIFSKLFQLFRLFMDSPFLEHTPGYGPEWKKVVVLIYGCRERGKRFKKNR